MGDRSRALALPENTVLEREKQVFSWYLRPFSSMQSGQAMLLHQDSL